jgi:hypothetical protein
MCGAPHRPCRVFTACWLHSLHAAKYFPVHVLRGCELGPPGEGLFFAGAAVLHGRPAVQLLFAKANLAIRLCCAISGFPMQPKTARILTACFLLLLVPLSRAEELPTEVWLRPFIDSVPWKLCRKGMAIRSCYSVSYEECDQSLTLAMRECVSKMKLPKITRSEEEAEKIGGNIASCALTRFVTANKQRKVPSQDCSAATK